MKEIQAIVRAFELWRGRPLALATLVRARGSSYRRPGARMLVTGEGEFVGSVSAGCLEDEVAAIAREVIATGNSRLLVFDTRRRFGCDGSIDVFVERLAPDLLGHVARELAARRSCSIETVFEGNGVSAGTRIVSDLADVFPGAFAQQIDPAVRLPVIGRGADGAALCRQADLLGWETSLMENITEWRGVADPQTVAVVATHNYGRDCAALRHLLPLGLPYVGVIGPRRRRDELLGDVLDSGAVLSSKFFAPAGLHLGADTPEEIALSIVAEIQSVLANADVVPLRTRRAPIHDLPSLPASAAGV